MDKLLKIVFSVVLRILLFPLRICKIKKDRLIFTGLTGGTAYEYSCNLKYLSEYIQKKWPGKFEIYWVVSYPQKYQEVEKLQGVCFLKHYTLRSFYYLLTAKVIVSSGSYAPWFPFRKKQYFINTWHGGGAYKRIENGRENANWLTRKRAEFSARNIDLFLSSCSQATKHLFRDTFLYEGEVMESGTPRNDLIVMGETKQASQVVRDYYGIDKDEKVVLYAPTHRESECKIVLDGNKLLDFLSRDGGKWRLLYHMHRYQGEQTYIQVTGERALSANEFPDMQMLLCAADMLITDYSSVIWDYSFLFRPCFLFVPDLDECLKNMGFYVDIFEWPFQIARTQEKLHQYIQEYDFAISYEKIKQHHCYMGSFETGHACKYAAERIMDICKEKNDEKVYT